MVSSGGYSGYSFGRTSDLKSQPPPSGTLWAAGINAISIEFVAKPQEAHRVKAAIPADIVRALKFVTGFAGCLVMISEHEARLVTVVTFWDGEDRLKRCSQNVRCVQALLAPYLDSCLRVQTMNAHLPLVPTIRPETLPAGESSVMRDFHSEGELFASTKA